MSHLGTFANIETAINSKLSKLENRKELVDILIKYGNSPEGIPTLHNAIKNRDLHAVKILVESGADVNARFPHWKDGIITLNGTTLDYAINVKDLEIADFLLSQGAHLDEECLKIAADLNFIDGLCFLLAHKAPLPKNSGQLLVTLLKNPNTPAESIKNLVAYGADCQYTESISLCNGAQEKIGLLTWAIPRKDLDLVSFLVKQGAPINYCLNDTYISPHFYTIHLNPLYKAIQLEQEEIAKYLISHGALVTDAHKRWFEYELILKKYNSVRMVQERGKVPRMVKNEEKLELDFRKLAIISQLKALDMKKNQELFNLAVESNQLDAAKLLFAEGAKVLEGHLAIAARNGDREFTAWLLENGAKL